MSGWRELLRGHGSCNQNRIVPSKLRCTGNVMTQNWVISAPASYLFLGSSWSTGRTHRIFLSLAIFRCRLTWPNVRVLKGVTQGSYSGFEYQNVNIFWFLLAFTWPRVTAYSETSLYHASPIAASLLCGFFTVLVYSACFFLFAVLWILIGPKRSCWRGRVCEGGSSGLLPVFTTSS